MEVIKIALSLIIIIGAFFMLRAIISTSKLLRLLYINKLERGHWQILFGMMVFFFLGYLASVFIVFVESFELFVLLTGSVFFLGAIFVYIVVKVSLGTINDLTIINRSKVDKEALSYSNERMNEAQRIAHLGNWELDFATGVSIWSDEACRIYGLSPEENKQTYDSWLTFIHPEDLNHVMEIVQEFQKSLKPTSMSHRIVRKDGTVRYIVSESRFRFDKQGNSIGIYGIVFDQTEKREAELEKEFDNTNQRALINNTSDLMWSVDTNLKLITANKAFDEIIKLIRGKSIEKGGDVLASGFEGELLARWKKYYERAFSGEAYTTTEYTKEPVEIWSEISFYPIRKGETIIGTACYSRNITEKKLAEMHIAEKEEALRNAIEAGKIVNFHADFLTGNLCFSDNSTEILGIRPGTNPMSYVIDAIHPDDREFVKESIARTRKEGIVTPISFRFIHSLTGKTVWVERRGKVIKDISGKVIAAHNLFIDITDRKVLEEQLVKSESLIRNFAKHTNRVLEDERGRIAREMHDELGQQLAGIKISLSSLKKTGKPQEAITSEVNVLMKDIEKSIQAVRNIATELRPGILDTLGLTSSIKWLGEEFEKKTGIKCKIEMDLEEQVFDKNISTCFFRICQEALTNISKHAGASEVVILLYKNEGGLMLQISDNGKGIASEKMENPFSMGLLGMYERANNIGADILITSRKDIGTSIQLKAKVN